MVNLLSVGRPAVDNITIDYNALSQLEVKDGGISSEKLSFGTWEKITEVSFSGASAVNITDLDGDNWDIWKIHIIFTSAASTPTIYVRLNNDSGSNYTIQTIYASQSTVGTSYGSSKTSVWVDMVTPGQCEITIYPKKGKQRAIGILGLGAANHLTIAGGKWLNTSSEVNQVNISFSSGLSGKLVLLGLKTS